MEIDFKEIIPKETLPRFNCQRRTWIKPAKLTVTKNHNHYEISYKIQLVENRFRLYKIELPLRTMIDNRLLVALGLYACEGRNPNKGVFTKSSGNKGRYLSIVNSDMRIIKLVIGEFESKLAIDRNRWSFRLTLFNNHDIDREKLWWSKSLKVKKERIVLSEVLEGDPEKASYAPHGRCNAELSSVIHATIIHNMCENLLNHKLFPLADLS